MTNATEELLSKINSYNLFNYLLPGVIFSYLVKHYSTIPLKEDTNLVIAAFLLYFTGMILNRIGSIVIEPFLKKIKFIKFSPYEMYVKAEKHDKKISLLSEANNTYRSILSTFLAFVILKSYEIFLFEETTPNNIEVLLICLVIFTIFLVSYIKQTNYIAKRVQIVLKKEEERGGNSQPS